MDFLPEVEIKTGGFATEYDAFGGILNVVTKSGSQVDLVAGLDLGSARKSRTPVAGSALAVGYGKDLNFALAQSVYEAEGEARKDVPPNSSAVTWPSGRRRRERSDRVSSSSRKPLAASGLRSAYHLKAHSASSAAAGCPIFVATATAATFFPSRLTSRSSGCAATS